MGFLSFFSNIFTGRKKTQLAKMNEIEVRKAQQESLDKLNGAFGQLIDKLESINDNFNRHLGQQDELLKRFEVIPQLIQRQTELIEQTLEQINDQAQSTKKFTEVVARIPDEAIRQTRELEKIKAQLTESTEFEKTMCQEFIKLNIRFKYQSVVTYVLAAILLAASAALVYYILTH